MISRILGINDLDPKGRALLKKYALLSAIIIVMINASTTYYILHVLSLVSIAQLGFLIAFSMAIQFILDYPTGAFGDWLGHRWVLFIAYVTFALSFWMLALSHSFESLLVVFFLKGVASAQHSEALGSWLHLNYRAIAQEVDPTRHHYKMFITRYKIMGSAATSVAYIVAGYIAFTFNRETLFQIQGIFFILLALMCVVMVNNLDEVSKTSTSSRRVSYFHHLIGGIKFTLQDKKIGFLTLSNVIWLIALTAWANFYLHRLYFSYTGSDVGAGLMRSITWWIEVLVIYFFASLIARRGHEWLYKVRFLQSLFFFGGFALLIHFYPLTVNDARLNMVAVTMALGIMALNVFFFRMYNTIFSVIYLEHVPDTYRNAVYSLIPTLTLIGNIPVLLLFGMISKVLDPSQTLFLLMLLGFFSAFLSHASIQHLKVNNELSSKVDDTNLDGTIDETGKQSPRSSLTHHPN